MLQEKKCYKGNLCNKIFLQTNSSNTFVSHSLLYKPLFHFFPIPKNMENGKIWIQYTSLVENSSGKYSSKILQEVFYPFISFTNIYRVYGHSLNIFPQRNPTQSQKFLQSPTCSSFEAAKAHFLVMESVLTLTT